MARNGFLLLICALLSATPAALSARPEDSKAPDKIATLLAVQHALSSGRDALTKGDYQIAVNLLEGELPRANVNREYLLLMRDAYRALIDDLRRHNRTDEIATYQRRLDALLGDGLVESRAPTAMIPPPPPSAGTPAIQAPQPSPAASGTGKPASALTARGVPPDDAVDPFSPANSKQAQLAREFLVRAEREFNAHHYSNASGLYDQAFRADETVLKEARSRWAYCRLYDVCEALKRTSPPPAGELEQEVRNAMSLAPEASELSKIGETLLRTIQEKAGPGTNATSTVEPTSVTLQHVPRVQGSDWAIVNTPNFRIYHNLDTESATKAARAVEAARGTATRKWFGDDGAPWNPRCELYLWTTGQAYATATGQSSECPGHSKVEQSGERILSRRIDIHVDAANWMTGVLPHETTHVVIAGRFGPHPVPRWADEGMAVLSEPRELVQRHLNNLPQHRQDGQLFSFRQLLTMEDYPKPRQVGAFYAQSVSLVDYLSRQPGGPQKFSKFLRDGLRDGYDVSLQRYYGLNSLQVLEGYWTSFAFPPSMASGNPQ